MATIKEWYENIECMSIKELKDYKEALEKLVGWDMFYTEYKDYGIKFLLTHIKYKLESYNGKEV